MNLRFWPLVLTLSGVSLQASDLSIFAGWTLAEDLKTDAERSDLKDFSVFGVRYEKDFLFILGFENTFAYNRNVIVPENGRDENGVYYSANLVFNFPNFPVDKIFPYVTLGLGFLHRFGNSMPDLGTALLTNWGAGVKIRNLAGPFGLRLDYRRLTVHDVRDANLTNDEISAGIVAGF